MSAYIERDTGAFPVSIGTSLAIEGLLGVHPDKPQQPADAEAVEVVYINLATVVRNAVAAMTSDQLRRAEVGPLAHLVFEELKALPGIVHDQTQGRIVVQSYYEDPETIRWLFPHANHKKPKTDRQVFLAGLEKATTDYVLKLVDHEGLSLMRLNNHRVPTDTRVAALLTHQPHQLLWRYNFGTLLLLESHTGKLKPNRVWSTKLKGVKADDHLPFTKVTLLVFGDGTEIEAQPRPIRDEVKKIAEKCHWTVTTTTEKIHSDITRYGSQALQYVYTQLMRR